MKVESLEKNINIFLQQNIKISVNNKFVKTGKLILFSIKDFYLNFTLQQHNSKKIIEIPYPYDFFYENNKMVLSYMLNKFHLNITDVQNHIKLLTPKKPNKFFNTYAEISIVENI